jgi:hypothetical protein
MLISQLITAGSSYDKAKKFASKINKIFSKVCCYWTDVYIIYYMSLSLFSGLEVFGICNMNLQDTANPQNYCPEPASSFLEQLGLYQQMLEVMGVKLWVLGAMFAGQCSVIVHNHPSISRVYHLFH